MNMRIYDKSVPQEIRDNGFDFSWDNKKVWVLDVPAEQISIEELDWILDLPFWSSGSGKYDIFPRKVLENMDLYREHKERVLRADISYPIDIMKNTKGNWLILDGLHRFLRLVYEGNKTIKVRKISRDLIPLIEK